MAGLFNTLNISKRGINVMQAGLNVTSHNISNASRSDYTRQRIRVQASSPLTTIGSAGQIGTGAQVEMVERVRNTFLDYQIRNENSALADVNVRQNVLAEIEKLVNESGDVGLSKMFDKFFDSWQELVKNPSDINARTIVLQEAANMTDEFNRIYNELQESKNDINDTIKNSVVEVNSILNEINELNQKIQETSLMGNQPNDFLDRRDMLLDELSGKLGISIDTKKNNGINVTSKDINLGNLVSNKNTENDLRLTFVESIETGTGDFPKDVTITYYKNNDSTDENNKVQLVIKDMTSENFKSLKKNRVILSNQEGFAVDSTGKAITSQQIDNSNFSSLSLSSGELGGLQKSHVEIDSFINQINQLAKALVFSVNAIHSGQSSATSGGAFGHDTLPFFVNSSIAEYDQNGNLINSFDVANGEGEITAGNITINRELLEEPLKLKVRENDHMFENGMKNDIDGQGNGERALAIASLRETLFNISDIGKTINSREDFFDQAKGGSEFSNNGLSIGDSSKGTKIESQYKNIVTTLGIKSQEASREADNFEDLVYNLEISRMSVSGVSLDEEMSNLITFQHAYNASAKVISTVDKLLDVIINGLMS